MPANLPVEQVIFLAGVIAAFIAFGVSLAGVAIYTGLGPRTPAKRP